MPWTSESLKRTQIMNAKDLLASWTVLALNMKSVASVLPHGCYGNVAGIQ